MKKWLLNALLPVVVSAVCVNAYAEKSADEECEPTVDMADSLDFHKMHVECDDGPIDTYGIMEAITGKNSKAVDTYEKDGKAEPTVKEQNLTQPKVAPASTSATSSNAVKASKADKDAGIPDNTAGVTFNVREPFTVTGGPQSALNGLYVQMVNLCPQGWEKLKEWVVPNQSSYYLHYQLQCAE